MTTMIMISENDNNEKKNGDVFGSASIKDMVMMNNKCTPSKAVIITGDCDDAIDVVFEEGDDNGDIPKDISLEAVSTEDSSIDNVSYLDTYSSPTRKGNNNGGNNNNNNNILDFSPMQQNFSPIKLMDCFRPNLSTALEDMGMDDDDYEGDKENHQNRLLASPGVRPVLTFTTPARESFKNLHHNKREFTTPKTEDGVILKKEDNKSWSCDTTPESQPNEGAGINHQLKINTSSHKDDENESKSKDHHQLQAIQDECKELFTNLERSLFDDEGNDDDNDNEKLICQKEKDSNNGGKSNDDITITTKTREIELPESPSNNNNNIAGGFKWVVAVLLLLLCLALLMSAGMFVSNEYPKQTFAAIESWLSETFSATFNSNSGVGLGNVQEKVCELLGDCFA